MSDEPPSTLRARWRDQTLTLTLAPPLPLLTVTVLVGMGLAGSLGPLVWLGNTLAGLGWVVASVALTTLLVTLTFVRAARRGLPVVIAPKRVELGSTRYSVHELPEVTIVLSGAFELGDDVRRGATLIVGDRPYRIRVTRDEARWLSRTINGRRRPPQAEDRDQAEASLAGVRRRQRDG